MKPIEFKGHNVVYAKDQPQYLPLPALVLNTPEHHVISCWELTEAERKQVAETGKIFICQLTFKNQEGNPNPLQPIRPETDLSNYFELKNNDQ